MPLYQDSFVSYSLRAGHLHLLLTWNVSDHSWYVSHQTLFPKLGVEFAPLPLRPLFVASSYLFFKQSLPLIFSLNNLSLSPTGCPTHSLNEVSPAPPSPSSSAPYQTHSQNCLLIVQLDNCHLSLLLLSVSHKGLNGFGRGGVQHEEGLWPCKWCGRSGRGEEEEGAALDFSVGISDSSEGAVCGIGPLSGGDSQPACKVSPTEQRNGQCRGIKE
ncbi:unnamed protein product [Leuciscus chuanchicus]